MVKYEKYETKTGKQFWRYYGHLGIDEKTGEKIKIRGRGLATKAEAKLNYERKVEEFKQAQQMNSKKVKRMKFSDLLIEFLAYYKETGIKPGTYGKFKKETNKHILPLIKDIYVDQIDINDCQNVYDTIKKARKDHNKIVNQLERILDFAISKQYITVNPMKQILKTKTNYRYSKKRLASSENFYSPTQLMEFLDAYYKVEEYHKFVYFRLLAFTGLRRGEALALYESDFLRKERAIDVNKTLAEDENGKTYVETFPKTEESKNLVYLDDDTFNYIEELIKNRNSYDQYGAITYIHNNKYLFPSPKTGKHYSRAMPNDWLNAFFDRNENYLKDRGIHRISPHGFRHSQATLLYELGVNPKDAQYRLRHKNLKTTMDIYTHITESSKRKPISKLDDFSARGTTLGTTKSKDTKKQRQEH